MFSIKDFISSERKQATLGSCLSVISLRISKLESDRNYATNYPVFIRYF